MRYFPFFQSRPSCFPHISIDSSPPHRREGAAQTPLMLSTPLRNLDGGALDHRWGFIDGTAKACCVTDETQMVLYNGNKCVHVPFICWFLENSLSFFKPHWKNAWHLGLVTMLPHFRIADELIEYVWQFCGVGA